MADRHKKHLRLLAVSAAVIVAFFVFLNGSLAQETNEPRDIYNREKAIEVVSESGGPGGCDGMTSCDAYCSAPANQAECMNWARANGVISEENYRKYYNVAASGGPGGCTAIDSCRSYCEDRSHFNECLDFAEKQGILSNEQAQKARKTGPGGCRTARECQAFCEKPEHRDACIEHAVQEGFMSKEEAQRIKEFSSKAEEFRKKAEEFRKRTEEFKRPEAQELDPGFDEDRARQILAASGGPGGCKTFDECEEFCDNPDNQLTCFEFAEKNNLFTNREHAEKIKRVVQEGGPGGCRGEQACRRFCENQANFETCLEFARKHDLIPSEEIERAKKGIEALKEGGPAGCRTREACERVCQNPAHQEACLEWAKAHGLISDEDAEFIEEANKIREEFEHKRGELEDEFRPPEGFRPPGEFLGPGGCTGAEECRKYCSDPAHAQECQNFRTPSGVRLPGFGGTPPPSERDYPAPTDTLNYPSPYLPPSPHDQPSPYPYDNLTDPAQECTKRGGTWTGSECKISLRDYPLPGAVVKFLFE